MFGSGSATLNASYLPLLHRIGTALQEEQGDVLVNGYTDNQPIHTVQFPSNFQLSQARADAVANVLKAELCRSQARARDRQGRHRPDRHQRHRGGPPAEPPHRYRAD